MASESKISNFTKFEKGLGLGVDNGVTKYSYLQFTLKARRKMAYQLLQTYLASVFFVMVTWLCFLIPPDMFEVRVGIAMSTLLTLTAMFAAVREQTPIVSYIKAIDIWMTSQIMFIFIALAAFTITAWIKRGLRRITTMQSEDKDEEWTLETLDVKQSKTMSDTERQKKLEIYRLIMNYVEHFAIFALSGAYIIFNVFYWSWLILDSEYYDWEPSPILNNIEE